MKLKNKLSTTTLFSGCSIVAITCLSAMSNVAVAQTWAHQNGSLSSNGAVTIKSLSGGTYTGTQNPTGAVAKSNQSAVTQPPTVIIQATSGSQVFSYKDDCYVMTLGGGYSPAYRMVGAGKLNAAGTAFTGLVAMNGSQPALTLLSATIPGLTVSPATAGTSYNTLFLACGTDTYCVYGGIFNTSNSSAVNIVQATSLPVTSVTACHP